MANVQHFESLSIIMVDFDLWTGQTRLSASDFKIGVGGQLPPEKLTQLGSKKVIDPDHLKGFAALKTQATRLLLRHGMKFMNGFAVPVDKTTELCDKLDAIGVEFQALKQTLLNDYNNVIEDWINEHPDHAQMIRDGALTAQEVEKRIGFEYQVFMIQPMANNEAVAQNLDRKIGSLGNDLIDEVTKTATDFFNKRFLGQTRIRTSTRQTLVNLRDKIDGLSFLNGALVPLVGLLNETLDVYTKHASGGVVEAPHFYQLMAVVSILKNADSIHAYAQGQVKVDSVADGLRDKALPGLGVNTSDVTEVLSSSSSPAQASPAIQETESEPEKALPLTQQNVDSLAQEPQQMQQMDEIFDDIDRFFQQHASQEAPSDVAPEQSESAATEVQEQTSTEPHEEVEDVQLHEQVEEPAVATPDPMAFDSQEEESLFF